MKLLKLTRGYFAQVDDELFDELSKYSWQIKPGGDNFYATRSEYIGVNPITKKRKIKNYILHRQVMGVTDPKIFIDHRDRNGLNCVRSNLRQCTPAENTRNGKSRKNSTSPYLGVYWDRSHKKWTAEIREFGKSKKIGRFTNEIEAAKAYDKKAVEVFGEFANPNFK